MPGLFSTRRAALLYLTVWLLLGLVLAGLVVSATGSAWIDSLLFGVPLTLVYAFASGFSAYYLCRAWPLAKRNGAAIIGVFGITAVLAGSMWTALGVAWNALLQTAGSGIDMTQGLKVLVLGLGIILYAVAAVAHYLAIEFERARLSETQALEAKLLAQDAELRMLRTQIDPHFLFNSLNSISALTSFDPKAARAMTLRLSDFFRHTLGLEAHRKVALSAEVELLQHFVAIEQVRFGERLRVEMAVADDAQACLLPPMILQPLVENAVKHGIGGLPEGGVVTVEAVRAGSLLRITIGNDVDADQTPTAGKGIGLANVRQRLATAYGHEASVHWTREAGRFRVELVLPVEE